MFQQLAQRRTSQMPLPTTESSVQWPMLQSAELKMQSLRSTQSQIGWLEVVSWSPWEAPKIWPQRPCFQLVLQIWLCGERPSSHLESMRKRRRVTRLSSRKTPATFHGVENTWPKTQRRVLPWIGQGYIKARDLVDCKAANVPFYAGTTLRREFCDWWHCDGGWIYTGSHSMWTTVVCKIVELNGWSLCSP